jgi:hypothetical protein
MTIDKLIKNGEANQFSLDKASTGASLLSSETPKLSSEMSSETYSLDMCMFFLYHQHAPEVTHRVGYFCFGPCAGSNPLGGLLLGYIAATLWVGYFWLLLDCSGLLWSALVRATSPSDVRAVLQKLSKIVLPKIFAALRALHRVLTRPAGARPRAKNMRLVPTSSLAFFFFSKPPAPEGILVTEAPN